MALIKIRKKAADREMILNDLTNSMSKARDMYKEVFDESGMLVPERLTETFMEGYGEATASVKRKFEEYTKACERERFSPQLAREYVGVEKKYNDFLLQGDTMRGLYRARITLKATVKKEPAVADTIAGIPVSRIKSIGEEAFGKDEEAMESFLLMLRTDEYLNGKLYKDPGLPLEEKNKRIEEYIRKGAKEYGRSRKE